MDRIAYTSLTAMRGAMARQAAVANNLANANTVGFRAEMSAAQSMWVNGSGLGARVLASEGVVSANMAAGTVTETGRPLDVAMNGEALLTVQAANGDEAYTRRGDLQMSPTGLVTTGDGHPVLGDQGPLTLPPADSIKIEADGSVWIVPQGGDANAPQMIDRLKLVSPTGSDVVKGTDGLFRVRGGGALPGDPQATLTSGSVEGSNVNASQSLIEMIEAARGWETQVKLLTATRDIDASAAELMRLPD